MNGPAIRSVFGREKHGVGDGGNADALNEAQQATVREVVSMLVEAKGVWSVA